MVANWLYGVSHHAALHATRTAARKKERERQVTSMPEPAVTDNDPWPDLQPILDQELSLLPDKYRAVVVLCDLEGKGRKEAARQLGCPEGTVAGRLARARAMLAKRLTRRGVNLSSAALAVMLAQKAASGCAPASVVSSTIKSASLFATGQVANGAISANVAILTEKVLKMMLINKLKTLAIGLLVLAAVGLGGGLLMDQATAGQEKPRVPSGPMPRAVPDEAEKELALAGAVQPADKEEPAKVEGTWKFTDYVNGERNQFLIKMDSADAKPSARVLVAKQAPAARIKEFRVEGKTISFTIDSKEIEFSFEGRMTGDGKKILGMSRWGMQKGVFPLNKNGYMIGPAMLTLTDARTIDDREVMVQNPDVTNAMRMTGKERVTALQDLLKKTSDTPRFLRVVHSLFRLSATEKDLGLDFKDLVKRADLVAAACGPAIECDEAMRLAGLLVNIDGQMDLALEQARRAEKLLAKAAAQNAGYRPPDRPGMLPLLDRSRAEPERILTMLETILKTAGKEDELKEVSGRLDRIEADLDKEYLAHVPPFKPTPSTERSKHGRAPVLELFANAQSQMNASAEVVFDALLKTYSPGDVVVLQYQVSGGNNPLRIPDAEERCNYYRRLFADKTSVQPRADGPLQRQGAQRRLNKGVDNESQRLYQELRERISPWFDAEAGPKLKLTATEKEGKIDIQATVDDLDEPGKDKRLRLVLAEESIHYAGGNSIRIHNRVVRAMPGGPAGFALKEAKSKQTATVDLAELRKQLAGYLEEINKKGASGGLVAREARPLDLKNLKLVALVQDDKTGEILQAAEVDLGAGKKEK